jgi:GGDEF domain-containing protein
MSLQGPILLVAEQPSGDVAEALRAAGASPIIETSWADASAVFMTGKPCAIVIAESDMPPSESAARMLCLQAATANGPVIPVIARMAADQELPVPIALAADTDEPIERMMARLRIAMRVRALHAAVLQRVEEHAAGHGSLPELPVGDPLDEATVMIVGRGPAYPAMNAAVAQRFGLLGALSIETAARHLETREIDGIVICDGQRTIDATLTVLAETERYRHIPVVVMGDVATDFTDHLPQLTRAAGDAQRIVGRLIPPVRQHALEHRLGRMMAALDSGGAIDPVTGLLTPDRFWHELNKSIAGSSQYGHALSIARFTFGCTLPARAGNDRARLLAQVMRDNDFACRDGDGSIFIAFVQTGLHSAHVMARRIAAALRNSMLPAGSQPPDANVTLATLRDTDTLESLLLRVHGGEMVAAG